MSEPDVFVSSSTGMEALWHRGFERESSRVSVYLHGAGGFGTGFSGLYEYSDFPSVLRDRAQPKHDFLIPSCHRGAEWDPTLVRAFLDDFAKARRIRLPRYDLIGYSRGGRGVYRFAAQYPSMTRTAVIVSSKVVEDLVKDLLGVPLLIIHGTHDQATPIDLVRAYVQELKRLGSTTEFVEKNGDHFIIADVAEQDLIYRWQDQAVAGP